jgi:hypothetical protein
VVLYEAVAMVCEECKLVLSSQLAMLVNKSSELQANEGKRTCESTRKSKRKSRCKKAHVGRSKRKKEGGSRWTVGKRTE